MARKAIEIFNEIQNPDEIIVTLFFNACAQLQTSEALLLVKKILKQMPKSFQSDPFLLTSLLDALMKCGDVLSAQELFNNTMEKSTEMYGAMMKGNIHSMFRIDSFKFLKGYLKNKMASEAIKLFNEIPNPLEITLNLLFSACAELGTKDALELVEKISKQMPKSFESNVRVQMSLLNAFMQCGVITKAQLRFDSSKQKSLSMYGAMMKGNNST